MYQEHKMRDQVQKLEVLSLLLSQPDDFLKENIENLKLVEVLSDVFPDENWEEFSKSETVKALLENISRDYLYLFVGVSKPLASPYMSSYYRANSRLMDVPARNVLALMKKWGIEVDEQYKDLPDHFLTVINLMTVLLKISFELEEDVLKLEIENDIKTLAESMTEFLPKVIERVVESQKVEYYSIILQIAQNEMEILKSYEMQ